MTTGGPLTKAVKLTSDQLAINGGKYKIAHVPAIPYEEFEQQARSVVGSNPIPVYIIDGDPDFADWPKEGGKAYPYYIVTDETAPLGELAIPVSVAGGGAALDADAQTLIAAMTTEPDSTRQTLISDTITSLKSAGVWDLLDECWFLAAHDEQAALLGWKRAHDATAVNAPTFTVDEGFTGDGSTSYLNTGYTPSSDGVNYAQNDASLGVYSRTDVANGTQVDIGAFVSGSSRQARINSRNGSDSLAYGINNDTTISHSNADSRGLFVVRRTGASAANAYRNGSEIGTSTESSSSPPAFAIYIGAVNESGSSRFVSTRQLAFAFVAAAMTAQQQSDLYDSVQSYMTSVGANV